MEPQPLAPRAIVTPPPQPLWKPGPHRSQAQALTDQQALPCGRHRPSYPGCPTLRASSSPKATPRLWLISVSGTPTSAPCRMEARRLGLVRREPGSGLSTYQGWGGAAHWGPALALLCPFLAGGARQGGGGGWGKG